MTVDRIKKLIATGKLIQFYKCKAWRRLRLKAIERDDNECQMCKALGKVHEVDNVHHIEEVKDFPERALDLNNLICLCYYHHNLVHERGIKLNNKDKKIFDDEKW